MPELLLTAALVSAVFQFSEILPFAPLSIWWLLLAVPALLTTKPQWPAVAALLIAAANVVIVVWSPVPLEALRAAGTFVAFAVAMTLAARVMAGGAERIIRPLAWAAPAVLLQCALTLIFFLSPDIEAQYFDWSLAPYFSGAGVSSLFTTGFNNVVFPEKAGGFFLNGNTASMFMASTAWLYLGLGIRFRRGWMLAAGTLFLGGAVASGSKTALLLAGTSLFAVLLFTFLRRNVIAAFIVALLAPLAGLFALDLLSSIDAFSQDTSMTVGSRGRIWQLAGDAISQHPVLGLGYGGWLQYFVKNGGFIGFNERPAHNFLLQTWLDGGLIYLLLTLAFVFACIVCGLRALRLAIDLRQAIAAAALMMSIIWVVAHGLADNTAVYGDWHALPFLGVAIVVLSSWARRPTRLPSDVNDSQRNANALDYLRDRPDRSTLAVAPLGGSSAYAEQTRDRAGWRCSPDCPFPHQRQELVDAGHNLKSYDDTPPPMY